MKARKIVQLRWGLIWQSKNKLDGVNCHPVVDEYHGKPFHFTRRAAMEFREKHYGYLRDRRDLKSEPHGWKMPRVARIKITYEEAKP